MTLYFASFGAAMLVNPSFVFAGDAMPVVYWATPALSSQAVWFARLFGVCLLVMALSGSLLRVSRDVFIRQCLLFNGIAGYLMYVGWNLLATTVKTTWLYNLYFQGVVLLANLWAVCTDSQGIGML